MTVAVRQGASSSPSLRRVLGRAESASLAVLVLVLVVLGAVVPGFAAPGNLQGILAQVSVVGIVALGLNLVILGGEIDISSGSVLALCSIVAVTSAVSVGGVLVPLACAVAVGAVVGLVNGTLSTVGRIPSIIVTLATLSIVRGAVLTGSGGLALNTPADARVLGLGEVAGIPAPIVILAAMVAVFGVVGRHTGLGRDVVAAGGNERGARSIGIRVDRARLATFVLAGAAVGLGSMVYIGQVGQVQATAATGFELQAIAAVVVGGTSIAGGRGSVWAPLIGAVFIGAVTNALSVAGVPGALNQLVLGALIILAILTDFVRRRVTGSRS